MQASERTFKPVLRGRARRSQRRSHGVVSWFGLILLASAYSCTSTDGRLTGADGGTASTAAGMGGSSKGGAPSSGAGGKHVNNTGGSPSTSGGSGAVQAGATGEGGEAVSGGMSAVASGGQPSAGAATDPGGTTSSAGSDDGRGGTSGAGAGIGAGAFGGSSDESPSELNGCEKYENQVAPSASRTIVWDGTVAAQPGRCMKIKAGQSVEFDGDFIEHPLSAFGGDSPNPISSQTSVRFAEPGLFGYLCTIHGSMTGAIWVIP